MRLRPPIGWTIRTVALVLAGATAGLAAPEDPPAAAGEEGKPIAHFETFVQDFGTVPRGERLLHSFVVRNDGDAPLEIESVKPT
ncbi:MAG: hypothetical protein PVF68_02195 [Acidobacteriota bacterium]|jgi:hypothetical protein